MSGLNECQQLLSMLERAKIDYAFAVVRDGDEIVRSSVTARINHQETDQ